MNKELLVANLYMEVENKESRQGGQGGGMVQQRGHILKRRFREKGHGYGNKHPWTRSAVASYVWMIYLGCRLTMLRIQRHYFRLHEEPAQGYGVCQI